MKNFLRWLLVLPAALATMPATFFVAVLAWNVVRAVNIVPQDSFVDVAFAAFGINALAVFTGVHAGASTAPTHRHIAAIVIAVLVAIAWIVVLIFRSEVGAALSISFGWLLWSSTGQIAGAAVASLGIFKGEKNKQCARSIAVPPDSSALTAEELDGIENLRILNHLKEAIPVTATTEKY
jgi:hypothetical protein